MYTIRILCSLAIAYLLASCGVESSPRSAEPVLDDNSTSASYVTTPSGVVAGENQPTQLSANPDPSRDDTSSTSTTEVISLKHHLIECEGFQYKLCFLIKHPGDTEWVIFYQEIEGLNYAWGYNYELLVEKSTTNIGLMDATMETFRLLDVLSMSDYQINESFEYTGNDLAQGITAESPNSYLLMRQKEIKCDSIQCELLDSLLQENMSLNMRLTHSNQSGSQLKMEAIVCADNPASFWQSCHSSRSDQI